MRWLERGLLLRGPSGSGKSDFVLRLLEAGAWLVADDLVQLRREGDLLMAQGPAPRGLLELRGLGIYRLAAMPRTRIHLCVRLGPAEHGPRLPESGSASICGLELPEVALDPSRPSAVARLRLLLWCGRTA